MVIIGGQSGSFTVISASAFVVDSTLITSGPGTLCVVVYRSVGVLLELSSLTVVLVYSLICGVVVGDSVVVEGAVVGCSVIASTVVGSLVVEGAGVGEFIVAVVVGSAVVRSSIIVVGTISGSSVIFSVVVGCCDVVVAFSVVVVDGLQPSSEYHIHTWK